MTVTYSSTREFTTLPFCIKSGAILEKREVTQLDSEAVTREVYEFLVKVNQQKIEPLARHTFSEKDPVQVAGFPQKYEGAPLLSPPQLGIFALYYILTKLGLISENHSQYFLQQEIKELDLEINKTQGERMEAMRKAALAEKSTKRWGIMTKVISWIGSFMTLITGITLMATGAGVTAGAMLFTAGVIAIANHLLEATGGWNKIAEKICGDTPEKTRAMIMWMQIGIAIVSFILSGAALVFGGFGAIKAALGSAGTLFTAIASAGTGVLFIGKGIVEKKHCKHVARMKEMDREITKCKQQRESTLESSQEGIESIKRFWEEFFRILRIERENVKRVISLR